MNNMNIIEELGYMDEKLDKIIELLEKLVATKELAYVDTDSVVFSDSKDWDNKIESYLSAADVMDDVKHAVDMIPSIFVKDGE